MESIPQIASPVLVVDDDEGLLLSIKATLVSSGLPEPALVSDSRRVIDLVREYDFQLILLDLMMPNLDGYGVLREMAKRTSCLVQPNSSSHPPDWIFIVLPPR